ncbi:MAG: CRISPR-associated protein family [Caloramator sp.]|jgi:CRISPR-associated RAMP protein (TIGR02581 family)|uniref:type III CRISPR-associated RAMP protein Csx7 n=1 Tax=Caloramator sp. TaxID=1871330 RepID=UPI001D291D51|nr:CRISPR-associated RAMP protein Csx7 [Caloramator sp.]MBZ4663742.1 CRISPR-associated protein family [Caloramator sp.]
MFKKLINEAIIEYKLETISPLFVKSGKETGLDPNLADNVCLKVYKDGVLTPVLPGTSIKGVFRSRTEKILKETCDILNSPCVTNKDAKDKSAKELYKKMCPACKIFGSTATRSRISFSDAYPENYKIGTRKCVAINRVTGAAKDKALFDMEYVEWGQFTGKIKLTNFFKWQIKTIALLFKEIDEGYITFGGLTTKGFGMMKVKDFKLKLRYYNNPQNANGYNKVGIYLEKEINGYENILNLLSRIDLFSSNELNRSDFNESAI